MKFIIPILLLLFIQESFCQAGKELHYSFRHIDEQKGLVNNLVWTITQDKKGYIWIGTKHDGIQRYDGVRFQNHRKSFLKPGSGDADIYLIGNREDDLFAISKEKLYQYYEYENRFVHTPFPDQEKSIQYTDTEGRPWFLNKSQVYRTDPETGIRDIDLIFISSFSKNNSIIFYDSLRQQYWLGSFYGLFLFDIKSKKVFGSNDKVSSHWIIQKHIESYSKFDISNILMDSHQNLWISFFNGKFIRFNLISKKTYEYYINDIKFRQRNTMKYSNTLNVHNFFEDNHGVVWIATYGAGLLKYDRKNDVFDYLVTKTDDPNSIQYNYGIQTIFQDREDNFWIGTDKGLSVFNPYQDHFMILKHQKNNPESLPNYEILTIFQTSNKEIWVGTWGGGITVFDSDFNFKNNFTFQDYRHNQVWSFIEDDFGRIWAGCQHGNILRYDLKKNIIDTTLRIHSNQYTIKCMAKDKEGNIYFGLHDGKVGKWDSKADRFIEYNFGKPVTLNNGSVSAIFNDINENIWVTTTNGFFRFDPDKMIFTESFHHVFDNNKSIPFNNGSCIQQFNDSILMLGHLNGAASYFNILSREFVPWELKDELQNKTINNIRRDKTGNIWFTADYGLYSFAPDNENLSTNYRIGKGMINSHFVFNQILELHNGKWATATSTEIVIFDPRELIRLNKENSLVTITGFNVFNNKKQIDSLIVHQLPVHLGYKQNFLTIEFATLNHSPIHNRKCFYKLSGIDKDWVLADHNLAVSYTNLPPGSYTFKVMSETTDEKDEMVTSFKIIISPPFWKTWWFYTICIATLAMLTYLLARRRIKIIRKESSLKQKILETEMAALRAQMNPHFIFNCMNAIDNLIQNNEKDKATTYLGRFAKLIRNVLDSSKNNVVLFQKDLEAIRLYLELEQLRFSTKFTYTIYADEELLNGDYTVPPMLIQPFIENAIHHGLLNKRENSGNLSIDIRLNEEMIIYTILDDGVGIKMSKQLKQINKPEYVSYGIQISKERLEIYNNSESFAAKEITPKQHGVFITDLYTNGLPSGTKVEVKLRTDINNFITRHDKSHFN